MPSPDLVEALDLLTHGELTIEGRLVDASNLTLRCRVRWEGQEARCVYKPVEGERPLWDFPDHTLARREVAAYLVSEATGWALVPPTVLRDGPLGVGSCQLWIDPADREPLVGFIPDDQLPADWHPIATATDPTGQRYTLAHADDARLARMAVFDAVVNNADRKGGHLLEAADASLYGVDNGLCFHPEPKLRTVLWGWADQPLPEEAEPVLAQLGAAVAGDLGWRLATYLSEAEVAALADRIETLRRRGRFPLPHPEWPAVPWPPM
ncbi:MAG TPA: SCO1664 family protein [Natronosporangium sp.]|nr:SCO1664 family protein [Natronosporangium sp.]